MPFVNGKYYMNPQYGGAMERAREDGKGKFGKLLGVLADILGELNNSSKGSSDESFGRHFKPPSFGGSAEGFPREPDAAPPRMILEPYPAPGSSLDPENPKLPRHRPEIIAIPLARNDVQGEFVEEGQSAQTAGQQQHKSQVENSADGHWVTIDHRHVFIHELSASRRKRHKHPVGKSLPESGQASIYADMFDGQKTSNGDVFDQKRYTAALLPRSRWHAVPLGTRVEVTHDDKKVVVEINDRGAGDRNPNSTRALDLSQAAASALVGHAITNDEDAKKVGLIHLDQIKIVPKDTPLGPVRD